MESIRMPTPVPARTQWTGPGARPDAPTRTDAGPERTEAVDLLTSVQAALHRSVAYQIIRRTFAGSAPEEKQAETGNEPAAAAPAAAPDAIPATATATAATAATFESDSVSIETRVFTVEAGSEPPPVRRGDPVLLDLNGNGVETTGMSHAVAFDLDADGQQEQVSFARGGDAFLALDRNGNGRIDNGAELFGDQDGAINGFEALRAQDANADGRIDAMDPVYARLQLIRARDDGSLETSHLQEAGVASISLAYRDVQTALNAYDVVTQAAHFSRMDGSNGQVVDVLVGYRKP